MVLILNSQWPFLTTWYTFGKGGTLFATKLYRVVQFWLRKLYLVVPFISAGKKGGDQIFQSGTDFFRKYWSPRTIYLVRGDLFWGDQLLRDSTRMSVCKSNVQINSDNFFFMQHRLSNPEIFLTECNVEYVC